MARATASSRQLLAMVKETESESAKTSRSALDLINKLDEGSGMEKLLSEVVQPLLVENAKLREQLSTTLAA